MRSGDHILAVNGVDPHGKSDEELASMLSGPTPRLIVLVVARGGVTKTFSFELERVEVVLTENHLRVANGKIIPDWVTSKYLPCFVRS